jgi:hypothetical protein
MHIYILSLLHDLAGRKLIQPEFVYVIYILNPLHIFLRDLSFLICHKIH